MEPMAQGLPTSSLRAVRALLAPLRLIRPIGWMGGKIQHVEAQLGHVL